MTAPLERLDQPETLEGAHAVLDVTMSVISIQSQVAYGHVGNSAAVFPMQTLGIDVMAVPTTLYSNRPGYPTIRGRILDAELVADLLIGLMAGSIWPPSWIFTAEKSWAGRWRIICAPICR